MVQKGNLKSIRKILIILVILLFNINLFSNYYVKGNDNRDVNVQPTQINIPLTIRDFKADYFFFEQTRDPKYDGVAGENNNNQLYYIPKLSEEWTNWSNGKEINNRLEITKEDLVNGKPTFTNYFDSTGQPLRVDENHGAISGGNHVQIIENVTKNNPLDLMAVELAKHTNLLYRDLSSKDAITTEAIKSWDGNSTQNKDIIKVLDNILYHGYEELTATQDYSGIKVNFKSDWIGENRIIVHYAQKWDNTSWDKKEGVLLDPNGNGWYTMNFEQTKIAYVEIKAGTTVEGYREITNTGEYWYKDGNWYDYNPDGKENDFNARLGTYEDAKAWYERIANGKYTFQSLLELDKNHDDAIKTAYRYVYLIMNSFFNDLEGLNTQDSRAINNLVLTNNGNGVYSFDSGSNGFFPMDGIGYGNEVLPHNYHFSVEGHAKFTVPNKLGTFTFTGDDDVWIYINGKKAIDLGGLHEKQKQQIQIVPLKDTDEKLTGKAEVYRLYFNKSEDTEHSRAEKLDLVLDVGKDCNFDIFYMERHTGESNLKIETNLEFRAKVAPEKVAYKIVEGKEIILEDTDVVYPGDTIYYKLIAKNEGNTPIRNVEFVDKNLGIIINSLGATSGNLSGQTQEVIPSEKITITANYVPGKEVDGTSSGVEIPADRIYKHLYYLPPGGTIEIKIPDYLKYEVTEADIVNGKVDNVLLVKGDVGDNGKVEEEITETVRVGKRDADIVKSIAEIVRDNINIPIDSQLIPGDKVTFKFVITNKSEIIIDGNKQAIELKGLKLTDILKINNDAYQKTNWSFTKDKINEFNVSNFDLAPNEVLELYAMWTVSIEEANYYNSSLNKDVINTATLTLPDNTQKTSTVEMKIKPPSLSIKKEVLDTAEPPNNIVDNDKTFTIMVKGSDGTQYNLEALAGTEYTLSNLKYGNETEGVRYTVSEIVPMNYTLKSITVDGIETNTVMLSGLNNGQVVVTNIKQEDSNFNDDVHVENKFGTYTNSGFTGNQFIGGVD